MDRSRATRVDRDESLRLAGTLLSTALSLSLLATLTMLAVPLVVAGWIAYRSMRPVVSALDGAIARPTVAVPRQLPARLRERLRALAGGWRDDGRLRPNRGVGAAA